MAAADRGLLRNRAFLAIWGAQILSQVAANAVTSALIILVAEITHSNTSSSFLILLAVLPAILFGIAGGVIVDRTDRRLVLIITNALRAAAIVPLLLFGTSLTVVYLVNFLVATVTIFFVPAEAALLPKIVGHRFLMVANSLFTFTFNGAFLVGFIILAPIVVSLFGYEILWVVIAFMFAAASILCVTLPKAPPASEHLSRRVASVARSLLACRVPRARCGVSSVRRLDCRHSLRLRRLLRTHHGAIDDASPGRAARPDPRTRLRLPEHAGLDLQSHPTRCRRADRRSLGRRSGLRRLRDDRGDRLDRRQIDTRYAPREG